MVLSSKTHVLFFVKSARFLRYFKRTVEVLVERGAYVTVVLDPAKVDDVSEDSLTAFKKKHLRVTYITGLRRRGALKRVIIPLRNLRNYLFVVSAGGTDFRQDRLLQYAPRFFRLIAGSFIGKIVLVMLRVKTVRKIFELIERAVPPDESILRQIQAVAPDVVLVSYRNFPCKSPDIDYLKAARSLGIPAAIVSPSWDTLTVKTAIQVIPEKVFVWNEDQRRVARDLHAVPESRISIIGAPHFDSWLARTGPSESREIFCGRFNLDPLQPIVLYFGSPSLREKNNAVAARLKEACARLLPKAQVVIRPYPGSDEVYKGLRGVTVLPSGTETLGALEDDLLFYDMVYHSAVSVAVNTTAIVDAMVIGRPAIVIVGEEFENIQKSEHFNRLVESGAASVVSDCTSAAHVIQTIVAGKDETLVEREAFLGNYIYPRGLRRPAGDVLAAEVLSLAGR